MEAKQNKQIIIITTDHWLKSWFTETLFPGSKYASLLSTAIFCDISTGTWDEHFERLMALLRTHKERSVCFACTDSAMNVYAACVEALKDETPAITLTGGHFLSFFLATNKLASVQRIAACQVPVAAVHADMKTLPDLGIKNFFKPLAECGSKGVFGFEAGQTPVNPLFGTSNRSVESPIQRRMALKYDELQPYLNDNLVGLVVKYVSPAARKAVVSIDGFVHDGKAYHYCISDNIYKADAPEEFDSLVTPSSRLSAADEQACWTLYDKCATDFIARGLDNQFFDVEAFLLHDGSLVVMEINCRTFSNQLPLFTALYGDNDMFSAALDLLQGELPSFHATSPQNAGGKVGVCAYLDVVPNGPEMFKSESGDAWYYSAGNGYLAHVYAVGTDEAATRARCDSFYAEVHAQFASQAN